MLRPLLHSARSYSNRHYFKGKLTDFGPLSRGFPTIPCARWILAVTANGWDAVKFVLSNRM